MQYCLLGSQARLFYSYAILLILNLPFKDLPAGSFMIAYNPVPTVDVNSILCLVPSVELFFLLIGLAINGN